MQGSFLSVIVSKGQGLTFGESLFLSIVLVAFCLIVMHLERDLSDRIEGDDLDNDKRDGDGQ